MNASAGLLRFARYAFMPNLLGYCGGDNANRALFQYVLANESDRGLAELLARFTGAMPYLRLIAQANGLADPFDNRVVEAYWIGNDLLRGVEARQLYVHLAERFTRQLQGRTRELVLGKAPAGARPHHAFHVLDVYRRTAETEQTLQSLDSCRVSWGRVERNCGAQLEVARQPLEMHLGKLRLADPRNHTVLRQFEGRGFADTAACGDWVSLHWGWACEVITDEQRATLEAWTRHHLELANETL